MLPDRVSNPGPLTYESGALPIALRGPAADIRRDMLNTITTFCPPTFNTLIWGNSELSLESNKEIFLSVQNFILKSKRFEIQ